MFKVRLKSFITVFLVIGLCTCIDPYRPKLSGYPSLLVVDGLVTNENAPCEVKLSRTIQGVEAVPEMVSDAVVTISDETGQKTSLINSGNGLYKTDNNVFTGAIGKTYILDIFTQDGKEYKSEPCTMLPVPEIDSLYYEKDIGYTNNQSETHEGISIYLDSKEGDESNKNYRWAFQETWKFKVPYPKKWNYINDSTILPVDSVKEFCWKQQNSSEILINSISTGQINIIKREPLCFISPDLSDRLTIQYSILAKQYSISKKESEFWANLKTVNESGGDISGSQPFPVISNISNINNSEEKVLGYFQVSAVSQKRKFITFRELAGFNLPNYQYNCARIQKTPADYCKGVKYCVPPTFNELYRMWLALPNYTFIEPFYDPLTDTLQALVFTTSVCADCELTGTIKKPDFWVDLN